MKFKTLVQLIALLFRILAYFGDTKKKKQAMLEVADIVRIWPIAGEPGAAAAILAECGAKIEGFAEALIKFDEREEMKA